jgi:hypothetical protein
MRKYNNGNLDEIPWQKFFSRWKAAFENRAIPQNSIYDLANNGKWNEPAGGITKLCEGKDDITQLGIAVDEFCKFSKQHFATTHHLVHMDLLVELSWIIRKAILGMDTVLYAKEANFLKGLHSILQLQYIKSK